MKKNVKVSLTRMNGSDAVSIVVVLEAGTVEDALMDLADACTDVTTQLGKYVTRRAAKTGPAKVHEAATRSSASDAEPTAVGPAFPLPRTPPYPAASVQSLGRLVNDHRGQA